VSRRRESGLTLPELIMSVAILGIIGVVIGGVLTAAFSSTTGIQERFDASRASKQSALYWAPDVKSAEAVNAPGEICGSGAGGGSVELVSFGSTVHPPVADAPAPPVEPGTARVVTWWLDDTNPARIVRRVCEGAAPAREVPTAPITSRIADGDGEVAGLAASAEQARPQVAVECSDDGSTFATCVTDDSARVVRLSVRVLDVPARSSAGNPQFKTYEYRVAGAREVR
jgi:prepilin-type N-terminal cleavage/methylation domain-containing protein